MTDKEPNSPNPRKLEEETDEEKLERIVSEVLMDEFNPKNQVYFITGFRVEINSNKRQAIITLTEIRHENKVIQPHSLEHKDSTIKAVPDRIGWLLHKKNVPMTRVKKIIVRLDRNLFKETLSP